MSGKNHREPRKPALADWAVCHATDLNNIAQIRQARFTRDQYGGYTFTDDKGIVADFPPGTVLSVARKDPQPEAADPGPIEMTGGGTVKDEIARQRVK